MNRIYKSLIICALLSFHCCFSAQLDEKWQAHWEKAIGFFNEKNFSNALNEYNRAIDLEQQNSTNHLSMYNERGMIYNLLQEYQKAINDFTTVLNNPNANREDVLNALWGRSKSFLVTGKLTLFEKDAEKLALMGDMFTILENSDEYLILQLNGRSHYDISIRDINIKMAQAKYNISFENQTMIGPSSIVILRKQS